MEPTPTGGPPGSPPILIRVETGAHAVVEPHHVRQLRRLVWALVALSVTLGVVVVLALPRSMAYTDLVDENLELKARLMRVDRQMSEVDRVLLRLRIADAQLRSIGEPRGDGGPFAPPSPFPAGTAANAGLDQPLDLDEYGIDVPLGEELPISEDDLRSPETWAAGIEARAQTFLQLFERAEPDLDSLMHELEQLRALDAALPNIWPTQGTLSSGFGWRRHPIHRRWSLHTGLDIANVRGTPIRAAAAGEVIHAEVMEGYGRMIDHGFGITTRYAHCHRLNVQAGQRVEKGQLIAQMGSTGWATGPHLHFEVHLDGNAVDPLDYLPR
jgi:murein DD-endopeptidase MepM/ murein hydrolase activator NlpD